MYSVFLSDPTQAQDWEKPMVLPEITILVHLYRLMCTPLYQRCSVFRIYSNYANFVTAIVITEKY